MPKPGVRKAPCEMSEGDRIGWPFQCTTTILFGSARDRQTDLRPHLARVADGIGFDDQTVLIDAHEAGSGQLDSPSRRLMIEQGAQVCCTCAPAKCERDPC